MEFQSVTEGHLSKQNAEGDTSDVAKRADEEDGQDGAKSSDTKDYRHDVAKSADIGGDMHDVAKLTNKDVHDIAKSIGKDDVAKVVHKEDVAKSIGKDDKAKVVHKEDMHDVAKSTGIDDDRHDVARSSDISEELDSLAFRYLDIVQSIIYEQDRLLEALGDGFVNMAKARYIMGNKSVGMLQVNEGVMKADCLVRTERDSYGAVEYTNFKISEECNRDIEKENQELRQRKVKNQNNAFNELDDSVEENLENKQKNANYSPGSKNPLQWFGVLVPKSLRTCQSQFRESLVIAAKVASLKSELLSVYSRYRELLAKEKEIQNNT